MNIIMPLFFVVLLLLIISWYRNTLCSDSARKLNGFPGPKMILPVVGNFLNLFFYDGGMPRNYNSWIAKYGKNVRFWNFHLPYLFTTDLEVIEKVLSSHLHIEKSYEYVMSAFFLKMKSILTSPGHAWKRDRKLLAPTFGKEMTNTFIGLVNQHSVTLMHVLEKQLSDNSGKEQDIRLYLGRCTLDIMTEFLRDDKLNFQISDPLNAVKQGMFAIMDSLAARIYKPWIALPIIRTLNGLHEEQLKSLEIVSQVIPKQMLQKAMQKWRPIGLDFEKGRGISEHPTKAVHILAAAGLSERELYCQIMGLTGAGSDTTTSAIAGICFLLAAHQRVQQKARQEVYEVISEYHFTQEITKDHLKQMIYLESVIKESLRIVTPGRAFGRRIGADIRLKNGKVIPKGTNVSILAAQVHTDPENYHLPHQFIPERFLPQNSMGRAQYSFIPFSAGPRSCIGQHLGMLDMKIIIARMLLWFELSTTKRLEDVEWQGIVASPNGGLSILLKKINVPK